MFKFRKTNAARRSMDLCLVWVGTGHHRLSIFLLPKMLSDDVFMLGERKMDTQITTNPKKQE